MTTPTYRTGRKVGRTIYRQIGFEPSNADVLIGMLDTPELAQEFVDAANARAAAQATQTGWYMTNDERRRRDHAAHERGVRAGRQDAAQDIRKQADNDYHPAAATHALLSWAAQIAEGQRGTTPGEITNGTIEP